MLGKLVIFPSIHVALAQLVERLTVNQIVAGSSPAGYVASGFIRGDALLSAAGIVFVFDVGR